MRGDGVNEWPPISPPRVIAPTSGASVNAVLGFSIATDPAILALDLVHLTTDYEIRTAPNGGGSLVYSVNNSLSLLGLIVPIGTLSGLTAGQTYYVRARFDSLGGVSSAFSEDVRITT